MNFHAITLKSGGGRLRELKTECHLCAAFDPAKSVNRPPMVGYTALWDTGATGSVISPKVVQQLNLSPTGKTKVYHAQGSDVCNVYMVNIILPNGVEFPVVKVTEGDLTGLDVLIGMDIITMGDFSITNVRGTTTFSFRVPSIKEIDYVREYERIKYYPVQKTKKETAKKVKGFLKPPRKPLEKEFVLRACRIYTENKKN